MSIEIKPSSERKCTNIPALVIAILFIVLTVILVAYCGLVVPTDTDNSIFDDYYDRDNHTDSCGNICGEENTISNSLKCGDPDKRNFPKLIFGYSNDDDNADDILPAEHYQCIEECPSGYIDISNECIKNDYMSELVIALKLTWIFILIMCSVAFVFSYVVLILFRHAAKYVIWIINIGFVFVVFALAFLSAAAGIFEGAITFGIIGLIFIGFLIYFRKRIALVAKLFKEASKALIDVPAIMFEPILTFISLLVSFLIFATFAVIISFADDDEPMSTPAHICNLISFIFITQFIIGCQNFIIAGTICRWYFTRDKTKLRKPIKKSFSHLFKFHLGSVCFGAILITIVKIIKTFITYLKNSAKDSKNLVAMLLATCCMCLFDIIEKLLAFLIRNAYVVVAKEGTPFCDSGKRAYRLLMDNINDVIALNHFGDLVLMVCRLMVVLIAGFVGYSALNYGIKYQDYIVLPMILGCILAFLIAHCFVEVFEMTVDTIFISFCIDIEENDGQTKPFYMSDSLKKIIMEMKEHSGGTLIFGPKSDAGLEGGADGSGIPMVPPPMYSKLGYDDSNSPPRYSQQFYPQQLYPQQQMGPLTQQPMMPQPVQYSGSQKY